MHVSREHLESVVSKWFDGSISDYKCEALASTYLERQDFRLYKYQNPFVSSESIARFFSQVESNTMSLCAPTMFNDPFDGQFTVPDWVDPQALYWVRSATDEIWRIGCLTERNNSLLMWAHYGASYRGVCIEYDFSKFSAIESHCMFALVMYRDSRPEIPESVITKSYKGHTIPTEDQNQLSKGLFTKSPAWKYECEWRIVRGCPKENRNSKYLSFKMPPIRKIYLGAEWRTPCIDSDWIYHALCEICEPRGIDIIETHLNAKSYTVDIS